MMEPLFDFLSTTEFRDLIVMGCGGVIATKRKDRWKIYDSSNLKNSLTDILPGEYRIGCNIAAFGAMIKTHSNAKGQYGARTTAALSAYLYGAYPMKISADGDLRIFFSSEDEAGNKYPAELVFP